MRNILKFFGVLFLLGINMVAWGKEKETLSSDKFEIKLIGRAFFDGGVFFSDVTELGNSVGFGDLRLGATMNIFDQWRAKIEISFANSEVALRDVYVEYFRGNHLIRIGHDYETFGLGHRVGTADIKFHTHATASRLFGDRRKLGVSYRYNKERWNLSAGIFSDQDVDNLKKDDEGYAVAGRLVYRPWMNGDNVLHLGLSSRFSAHGDAEGNKISFTGGAPSGLIKETFIRADVTEAINQWRFGAELIWTYNRFYMQSEYLRAYVNRFASVKNYTASGGYVQAGYTLLNGKYGYNSATSMSRLPGPNSLELVARYSITDTNNLDAEVMGGRQNDLSLGVIYYFNRYLAAKVNYSWVEQDKYASDGKQSFNMLQGRFQINF